MMSHIPKLGYRVNGIVRKLFIEVDSLANLMGNTKYKYLQ